ncbi:Phosphate transporter family protein [Quadrisphaera granulorum]|uniref:Phosphate transporter family protein n=1 Tax=Quadrisphaera granulorum TaxID=317664 RepID=A0A316A2I1_9ACTN|nr:inorganic phosphate transporter [Quadrisphaera granulorum]PWJ51779.1 phosphate transporter family protein [Quadrisphaera granulorum]SZE97726.1 Phosphate transporter family protein [Quadrisphaera granulorum]
MTTVIAILVLLVVVALSFDFTNGFRDTANALATSIATGALKPKTAVLLSGLLNLVGAVLSVEVALTVTNAVVKIQNKNGAPPPGRAHHHRRHREAHRGSNLDEAAPPMSPGCPRTSRRAAGRSPAPAEGHCALVPTRRHSRCSRPQRRAHRRLTFDIYEVSGA